MALSFASATIHRHSLITASASAAGGEAAPPHDRRSSSSIKIPTSLSNLLHLHVDGGAGTAVDARAVPAIDPDSPVFSPKEDISSLFPEIHGRGPGLSRLLCPLHPALRREIIKYGELVQATYDAFDSNPLSEFCGSCLYGRSRLLDELGLDRLGYDVSRYLYAMSHVELPGWLERSTHADAWSTSSNWIGFVSVSGDAESRRLGCRDLVVAWRGTLAPAEWFEDMQGELVEPLAISGGGGGVKVERGFLGMYTDKREGTRYNRRSAAEQVMAEIGWLVEHYKYGRGEEVSLTITGHSLGGALALLNAYEAAAAVPEVPVTVVSFGAPRVGNAAFGEKLQEMKVKVVRVAVKQDVVPKLPGLLFNEAMNKFPTVTGNLDWVYAHAGAELSLDATASPYLKRGGLDAVAGFHNLETYLHLVDGHSEDGCAGFRGAAKRDVALVNKWSGMLREELRVPACWYQAANKGMRRNAFGRWVMPGREAEDIPSPHGD